MTAQAPGRINLIGEHTDYNEGFVLPTGIADFVEVAVRRREDRAVRRFAMDFDQVVVDIHRIYGLFFRIADNPDSFIDMWSPKHRKKSQALLESAATSPEDLKALKRAFKHGQVAVYARLRRLRKLAQMGIHAFELQVRNDGIETAILNKGSNNVNPDQTITDDKQTGTWVKAGATR